MSKIGKINIAIPEKVKVTLDGSNLRMEGPLGKNNLPIDMNVFECNIKEGKEVSIKPKSINQNTKRIWGLNRSLINNAIKGINEGYIIDYKVEGMEGKDSLCIDLKYNSGNPVINSIQRVSKPGRRIFSSAESLPKVSNGLGIAIISTPKGIGK